MLAIVIVSWSLNPQHIVETEEHDTASLYERLKAAQKCYEKKFLISFHIDPVIWHPQWKMNYTHLVNTITDFFEPQNVC